MEQTKEQQEREERKTVILTGNVRPPIDQKEENDFFYLQEVGTGCFFKIYTKSRNMTEIMDWFNENRTVDVIATVIGTTLNPLSNSNTVFSVKLINGEILNVHKRELIN